MGLEAKEGGQPTFSAVELAWAQSLLLRTAGAGDEEILVCCSERGSGRGNVVEVPLRIVVAVGIARGTVERAYLAEGTETCVAR